MKTAFNIIKSKTYKLKGHTVSNYENSLNDNFLSLAEKIIQTLDDTFSWKNHKDIIVPKLNVVCFAVRAVKPFLSQESREDFC
jgi:hypothetical protein